MKNKISQYCEVCSRFDECGGKPASCVDFDPIVDIRSKHGRKHSS